MDEVRRMVIEIASNDLSEQKFWYTLKYDREMAMAIEGNADVRMFLKRNDKHRYFYVGDSNGSKRRA